MDPEEEERLLQRVRELTADTLQNAIECGQILHSLKLNWKEYRSKKVGMSFQTGYKNIQIYLDSVDPSGRLKRVAQPPNKWTDWYMILRGVNPRVFDAMLAKDGFINAYTTRRKISDFVKLYRKKFDHDSKIPVPRPVSRIDFPALNTCLHRDCKNRIKELPDRSIHCCVTSPLYANHEDSVSEQDYPKWFADIMTELWPKLTDDGNVLVVI